MKMKGIAIKAQRYANLIGQFCKEKPLGAFGAVVFFIMILLALGAHIWATADPLTTNIKEVLAPPSKAFWFGTDNLGRDTWSRFVHGARNSVLVVICGVFLSTIIGGLLGIMSGYRGGKVDLILQRIMDFFLGIPVLLMGLIVMVALGPALINVVLTIGIVYAPRVNRLSRSTAIAIRQSPYIEG